MASAARLRIAITQRVCAVPERGERRDALDQAWAAFFEACGMAFFPAPNAAQAARWLADARVDGLVLSGGNDVGPGFARADGTPAPVFGPAQLDSAPERDRFESEAIAWASERGLPILGVCRGMQILNVYYSGSLAPVDGHVARSHELRSEAPIFPPSVNSFHRFGLAAADVAPEFRPLACAREDGHVEAFAHRARPQAGIMWHPERAPLLADANVRLFREFFSSKRIPS